jgi:hypothetical protein
MNDNDAIILKRWSKAEINNQTLLALDLETPRGGFTDRTPQENAVLDEHFQAQQALKNIADPVVQLIVARIVQPMPDVLLSDPAYQATVNDWTEAKKSCWTSRQNLIQHLRIKKHGAHQPQT